MPRGMVTAPRLFRQPVLADADDVGRGQCWWLPSDFDAMTTIGLQVNVLVSQGESSPVRTLRRLSMTDRDKH
jgi:hypothetical protein